MELTQLEWVASMLGVLGSSAALIKWLWPKLNRLGGRMFGNHKIHERLDEMSEQMGWVVSELKINNGESIKDQLNRMEDGVTMNAERQRARMLDSEDMVFETDAEGNCIWVNRTYSRTVQRTTQELMGRGWVIAIAPDHRERVVQEWYSSTDEDREFEMNFNFATPDGDEFPALVRSYKMTDRRDNVLGYLGSVTLL